MDDAAHECLVFSFYRPGMGPLKSCNAAGLELTRNRLSVFDAPVAPDCALEPAHVVGSGDAQSDYTVESSRWSGAPRFFEFAYLKRPQKPAELKGLSSAHPGGARPSFSSWRRLDTIPPRERCAREGPLMIVVPGYAVGHESLAGSGRLVAPARRAIDGRAVILETTASEHPPRPEADAIRRQFEIMEQVGGDAAVPALDLVWSKERPVMVLDAPAGTTLRAGLASGPMRLDRFLAIARQVAAALCAIHRHNVVHLDVCPENIFIREPGQAARFTGFACASKLPDGQPIPADNRTGSLPYVSPEQTGRTNNRLDHRSDLYSLGIVFYELLSGRCPFRSADPLELMHSQIAREAQPLEELRPELPRTVIA